MTMRSTSGNGSAGPNSSPKTRIYKILPRENFDQGLPAAMVYCESRAMLADRVVALREALVFAPRLIRRVTGAPCLRQIGPDGMRLRLQLRAVRDDAERALDRCSCAAASMTASSRMPGALRFAERIVVTDATNVPLSLVFPI